MQDQDRSLRVVEAPKPSFELIAVGELRCAIGLGRFDRHDGELRAPPAPVAPDVGARANEQPVQPGIEPLDVAQRRQIPPGSNQRVLGCILREFGVAQDEASDPVQPIDGATGQDAEGLMVSASRPVDEFRLHVSLHIRGDRSGRLYATAEHKAEWFKTGSGRGPDYRTVVRPRRSPGRSRLLRSRSRGPPSGAACPRAALRRAAWSGSGNRRPPSTG